MFIPLILFAGCSPKQSSSPITVTEQVQETPSPSPDEISSSDSLSGLDAGDSEEVFSYFSEKGTTMESRITAPEGYVRIPSTSDELTGYLRGLPLKESGSEVSLYNGLLKSTQDHAAVFDLDIGDQDLLQCADSIIRIYAEYYWSIGAYEKIAFHLTNGFYMEYTKWRDGNRLKVDGNQVEWVKTDSYNDTYASFQLYLKYVFIYAGTLSLSQECREITLNELKPGDMFLYGGSPGHCEMVVDIAQDQKGNRCYLLAQGYMPAQDFHILKNPLHLDDPWYYASEITYPLKTPSWTFNEGSMARWSNFLINEAAAPFVFPDLSSSEKSSSSVPAMSQDVIPVDAPNNSSKVTILAVGDNLIHMEVVKSGLNSDGTYEFDHLYENLKEKISSADIAVINQETILGGNDIPYSGYPNFNSPTEIGDGIIKAGFDVVLHATNHTLDMGYQGLLNTFAYWEQYPDIKILGINQSEEDKKTIPVLEKNGIKLAMLNYTFSLNGHPIPEDKPYLVNMLDKDQIREDILLAEEIADFTIIFPHWGTEYVYEPISMQKELTELFYELGADLVIGTHPHVLEPVEWIETKKGHKMLVYYSLGNFMSYQKEAPRMLGGIAEITIIKGLNGAYISDASISPIITHYENGPADFNYGIYTLNDYTQELAQQHGVSELAQDGVLSYDTTITLAKKILGNWYPY